MKRKDDQRINRQIKKIALLTDELHDLKAKIHKANNDNIQMKYSLTYKNDSYIQSSCNNNDNTYELKEESYNKQQEDYHNSNDISNNSNEEIYQITEIPEENEDEREFLSNLHQLTSNSKSKTEDNNDYNNDYNNPNQFTILSQQNILLTKNVQELSSKIEHFNIVIPSLLSKIEQYKITLEESNTKTLHLQEKIVISKTENKALKSEISKLKSETTLLKTENDSLQKMITSLYDKNKELNNQLETKNYSKMTMINDYDNISNNQQNVIRENELYLSHLIEKLKKENKQYEKVIQQYEISFNQAKEEIRILSADNEEWKEYYTKEINDLVKKNQKLLQMCPNSTLNDYQ